MGVRTTGRDGSGVALYPNSISRDCFTFRYLFLGFHFDHVDSPWRFDEFGFARDGGRAGGRIVVTCLLIYALASSAESVRVYHGAKEGPRADEPNCTLRRVCTI